MTSHLSGTLFRAGHMTGYVRAWMAAVEACRQGRGSCLQENLPVFRQRGYRLRLLSAAFRNHMHWSEFIGGDVVISPPYAWQVRFNASDVEVRSRVDDPVPDKVVEELSRKFADFRRASTEDGLNIREFDSFGPTRRTLRQFIAACHDLDALVRDFLLPNPDALWT